MQAFLTAFIAFPRPIIRARQIFLLLIHFYPSVGPCFTVFLMQRDAMHACECDGACA